MLKKLSVVLLAFLFVFSSSAVYAGEAIDNIKTKLNKGALNAFTGWMEIPTQIYKGFNQGFRGDENNKVAGVATGAAEGILAAYGRTVSGIADVLGCWALDPASDEGVVGIPTEAENAWEDGAIYDLRDPNVQKATIDPVGTKLQRGLANTLFGIAEVPGQIVKGIKEGSFGWGIDKALVHFLSREISGLRDLVTVCVPTPKAAAGNTFDNEWPWTDLCENMK